MSSDTPGLAIALHAKDARDLMTPAPACVFSTDPLESAADLLVNYSAVPVVDLERRVVGVLSRTDLARVLGAPRVGLGEGYALALGGLGGEASGLEYRPPTKRVADVMTPGVVTVPIETSAAEVVRTLADRRIGRVFVVDAGQHLVGVVSTTDIVARLRAAV